MNKILCHLDTQGRCSKPASIPEYGKLRDRLIQKTWDYVSDWEFILKVTRKGHPFYGCLFNGRDLMEKQSQRECWFAQTVIGLDFDDCPLCPYYISEVFIEKGFHPWLGYRTFSDKLDNKRHSFRLLWKVEVDPRLSYERVFSCIKFLSNLPEKGLVDFRSRDPSRLWQGSDKGPFFHSLDSPTLNLQNNDLFVCPI